MATTITAYGHAAPQITEPGSASPTQRGGAHPAGEMPTGAHVDPAQAKLLKLKKAATQFEAMLLQKWWSSMKESGLGEDDDSDPGAGTLDTMGMQAMSTAIAGAGGIGIAAMLVRSLQGEIAARNATASPGTSGTSDGA